MSASHSFDDALNAAIDALRAGQPLEAVLAAHPRYAATLRPLLQTSSALGDDARPVPDPVRLEQHYSAVRSALRDARRKLDDKHRPWWQPRRVAIASLSLPAVAIAAIAFAGVGGAAAATLITGPALIQDATDAVTPDWVQDNVPGLSHRPDREVIHDPAAGVREEVAGNEGSPATDNLVIVATTGVVSRINGSTFTLISEDQAWHVVTDGNTAVTGTVVDGATVSVTGWRTNDSLHAQTVTASGGDVPATGGNDAGPAGNDANGNSDDAPGHIGGPPQEGGTPTGNSGEAPGLSSTPAGNSGDAPGQTGTPPAQSDGAPGLSNTPAGNSGDAPGQTGTPAAPSGDAPGTSKTATPAGASGTPHGGTSNVPARTKTPSGADGDEQ